MFVSALKDLMTNELQIINMNEWYDRFFKNTKKEIHWKEGRSAYSIADFLMNKNGEKIISDSISNILNEEIILKTAYPEMEVRFDTYGHGREHDIGIWGETISNKKIFYL